MDLRFQLNELRELRYQLGNGVFMGPQFHLTENGSF